MRPLPLMFCGYALAGFGAATLWAAGVAGVLAAVAVFWLGGAVTTLGLAAAPRTRRLFVGQLPEASQEQSDETAQALTEALRRWEADRHDDMAPSAPRRDARSV